MKTIEWTPRVGVGQTACNNERRRLLGLAWAAGAMALGLPAAARAQSWTAAGSSPFLWSNQSPLGLYRSVNTMMLGRLPRTGPAGAQMPGARPRAPLAATDFERTGGSVMPARMAASGAPAQQAELRKTYEAILDAYLQLLKGSGELARLGSNVAGALTFLVTTAHYVHHGGAELSEAQQELILGDFNDALAQTPAFVQMSHRQRQELFETAGITGAYVLTMYRLGVEQRNPAHVKTAKEVADLAVEQVFGVARSRLALEQGVRVR